MTTNRLFALPIAPSEITSIFKLIQPVSKQSQCICNKEKEVALLQCITHGKVDSKRGTISSDAFDECNGIDNGTVSLSNMNGLLNDRSNNGENNMDCTITTTQSNTYSSPIDISSQNIWQSDFIMLDVMADSNHSIDIGDETSRRRRMESDDDSDAHDNWLSECEPTTITYTSQSMTFWDSIDYNNDNDSLTYPLCLFYNENTNTGCCI